MSPVKLNGHSALAAVFSVALMVLGFGTQSDSVQVQMMCIASATLLLIAAVAHDAVKSIAKERTVRTAAVAREQSVQQVLQNEAQTQQNDSNERIAST